MDILVKGGLMMFFILACSIIVVTVFIWKIIHLHRAQINISDFMAGLSNMLTSKRITEAVGICEEAPGPAAGVLREGILHHEDGVTSMEKAMEKIAVDEIGRMEKGIHLLATVAVIAPLFGLLGTILGLMDVFGLMTDQGGLLTAPELAAGMWLAMLPPAFGFAVAIPAYIAYNYLTQRVHYIVQDMEKGTAELVGIMGKE